MAKTETTLPASGPVASYPDEDSRSAPASARELPFRAKLFSSLVITLGIAAFGSSLYRIIMEVTDFWWVALLLLTVLAGHFTVTLPVKRGRQASVSITMGDVFVFLAILFFGPSVGVFAAVAEGATMNYRARVKDLYKRLFNLSQLAVTAFVVGRVFYLLNSGRPALDVVEPLVIALMLACIGFAAVLYFLLNTGLVALAMATAMRVSVSRLWKENFAWTWIPQSAGACLAAFTFLWIGDYVYAVLVVAPTVVLIYFVYRINLDRIKQAHEHLEETRKLLKEKTKAEEALQKAKLDLEERVMVRTRELTQANQRLMSEVQERVAAEENLAAEKDRLAVTLSSIAEGVIAADQMGRIILINSAAEELTGWTAAEAEGKSLSEVFQVEGTLEHSQISLQAQLNRKGHFLGVSRDPIRLKSRDGTEQLISYSEAPIRASGGRSGGAVLVFRDISEERRIEAELLKAQKLESVGLLAGGIAHDFNNILAGILLKSQMARRALQKGDSIDGYLISVEEATQKASALTQQLLTFAKGGAPIKEICSIAQLLEESVEFCLRGSGFGCKFEIAEDLWNAEIDKGQISQVVNNLVINAKQAMPTVGSLVIRAENFPSLQAASVPELKEGDYVKIQVEDTGTGIAPEDLNRIFEPYFTTKSRGHGLGLASVYSIINRHGGHILVESTLGQGTTFTFFLPASTDPVDQTPESTQIDVQGSGKVLIMDDDELLRECACEILAELGYEPTATCDGAEACITYQVAKEEGKPFAVVILDLTIRGGIGGKETIQRLREIDPDVRAVVASGYSADPIMANPHEHGFLAVLTKPFSAASVASALSQVLSSEE